MSGLEIWFRKLETLSIWDMKTVEYKEWKKKKEELSFGRDPS